MPGPLIDKNTTTTTSTASTTAPSMDRQTAPLYAVAFLEALATLTKNSNNNHNSNNNNNEEEEEEGDNIQASSEQDSVYLPSATYLCEPRHEAHHHHRQQHQSSAPAGGPIEHGVVSKWRMNNRDRMKTASVALVMCLNIGVDPPDVIKLSPCARLECWIDPPPVKSQKALEAIGKKLQEQYERWQPRAQCKVEVDPTYEAVRELCRGSRRSARSERVLFHYNGHGVPKPTENGEIWLFNRNFTQYIPLSVFELEGWLGSPSIFVFDCSAAGLILNAFCSAGEEGMPAYHATKDCIMLAACGPRETLPQSPELPADVFTSCLTTPIKIALKWFCKRSLLKDILDPEMIDKIPGKQPDRKTPLGELNWIFTAITDTIAWNVLPRELFQRLFRQDLLVASLFRNFLLAERIMRTSNCTPRSHPRLPSTHQHPMWQSWDLAAEMCLVQLPKLLSDPNAKFQPSPFFESQLTAFEVWLEHGSERKAPPEQLPIILQVLLSQPHRYRALVLLGKFLDMGAWAVNLALSVGIFPCVLKLLQTVAADLRRVLVFIWTKILALDKSCQVDLVKDNCHLYFLRSLENPDAFMDERAMAAFVLTVIADAYPKGQKECIDAHLPEICIHQLLDLTAEHPPLLAQWLCLCLAKLWDGAPEAQRTALVDPSYVNAVARMLTEPQPEVRAAATYALGSLLGVKCLSGGSSEELQGMMEPTTIDEHDDMELRVEMEREFISNLLRVSSDGSPLVRTELCIALARLSYGHNEQMQKAAGEYMKQVVRARVAAAAAAGGGGGGGAGVTRVEMISGGDGAGGGGAVSSSSSSGRPIPGTSFSSLSAIIPLWGGSSGSAEHPSSFDSSSSATFPAPSAAANSGSGRGRSRSLSEGGGGGAPRRAEGRGGAGALANEEQDGDGEQGEEAEGFEDAAGGPGSSAAAAAIVVAAAARRDIIISSSNNNWDDTDSLDQDESASSFISTGILPEYLQVARTLFSLAVDPSPHVATLASNILLRHCGVSESALQGMSAVLGGGVRRSSSSNNMMRGRETAQAATPLHAIMGGAAPTSTTVARMMMMSSGTSPNGSLVATPCNSIPPPLNARSNSWGAAPSGLQRAVSTSEFISPGMAAAFRDMTVSGKGLMRSSSDAAAVNSMAARNNNNNLTINNINVTAGKDRRADAQSIIVLDHHHHHQQQLAVSSSSDAGRSGASSASVAPPYLPKSTLYKWSSSYFSKPMYEENMESDEGMLQLRQQRERMVLDGITKCQRLCVSKVSDQIAQWDTESNHGTKALLLHPFLPIACIADHNDTVRVWNYEEDTPLVNIFENSRENEKSGVARMCLLNELNEPLLLVASSDGGVRVWRHYTDKDWHHLVTAWQALPCMPTPLHSSSSSSSAPSSAASCVADWQQHKGYLYAGGEMPCFMVWDLERESVAARVPTECDSAVACITASQVHNSQVVAGFADGSLRIFDMRARGVVSFTASPPSQTETRQRRVVGVDFEPAGDSSKLISAYAGSVYFMDMRNGPMNAITARVEPEKGHVTSFAVHRHVPVIATGSSKQVVTVYNTRGEQLSVIRYHNSFLGQRIGPVSCLQFHPYSILLAAGASDSIVSMYAGETQ